MQRTFSKFLAFSISFLALQGAMAFGTESGGGGDIVVLPDGRVVLADPFLDHGVQQPNNMPARRALNPRILKSIDLYAKSFQGHLETLSYEGRSEILKELKRLSERSEDLIFYGLPSAIQMNEFCATGGRKTYSLPTGARAEQVACTAGNETYLVEPLFAQLSLKDQALLLIHERLTTLRDPYGGKNYSAVARFTTGLGLYLDLYREQSMGIWRNLSAQETENLTRLYISTEELELRSKKPRENSFQWVAHSYGGGRVHNQSLIHPNSKISVDSLIVAQMKVGEGSTLLSTKIENITKLSIGSGSKLESVSVNGSGAQTLSVGDNVSLIQGTLEDISRDKILIASNQVVYDFEISNQADELFTVADKVQPILFQMKSKSPFEFQTFQPLDEGKNLSLSEDKNIQITSDLEILSKKFVDQNGNFCLFNCYEHRTYRASNLLVNLNIPLPKEEASKLHKLTKEGQILKSTTKKTHTLVFVSTFGMIVRDQLIEELKKSRPDISFSTFKEYRYSAPELHILRLQFPTK